MKLINWLLFDSPLAILVRLFELITGFGFDFPAGTDSAPRLVMVAPERIVVSGILAVAAMLLLTSGLW